MPTVASWMSVSSIAQNFNSLQLIVAINVIENASVNSDDGKDDAEQRNCCKFVDKLHTDIHDSAWVREE